MRARRRLAAAALAAGLLLLATPASAEDPVFEPEDTADVLAALTEATEAQGVCYGWSLTVADFDTGQWGGGYGETTTGACPRGTVQLAASITYESSFSEAEDSASWTVLSDVGGVGIADVEDLGLSSADLLDDGKSALTLQNAVLSLPRLASERAGLPPVLLEPNTAALPEGAAPTGTPGSDWLRESGPLLAVCVLAVLGGLALLVLSLRTRSPTRSPGAFR